MIGNWLLLVDNKLLLIYYRNLRHFPSQIFGLYKDFGENYKHTHKLYDYYHNCTNFSQLSIKYSPQFFFLSGVRRVDSVGGGA